jgi:lipopolysaccharide assembly outer membrane protein LptD (OstA)
MKTTEWKASKHKRLFRLSNTGVNVSFGYNIDKNLFNKNKEKEKKISPSGFGDWNINITYNFDYNMNDNRNFYMHPDSLIKYTHRFTNSLSFSGAFALTPKWNLRFQSGYNITEKSIILSEFGVERDLHCWTIHFVWRPFGYIRGFEFRINAKANILKDANQEVRRDYRDN